MIGILTGKIWAALAVVGAFLAVLAAAFINGRAKGRKDVNDEMQDAYNSTTKDLHNAETIRPADPDAVLDELHKYTE